MSEPTEDKSQHKADNPASSVAFDAAAAAALLADVTAPWVRDLGLEVTEITPSQSRFFLPFSDRLTRDAGMICGQAIVAAADTAMIAAVTAAIGSYGQHIGIGQTGSKRLPWLAHLRQLWLPRLLGADGDSGPHPQQHPPGLQLPRLASTSDLTAPSRINPVWSTLSAWGRQAQSGCHGPRL